MIRKKITQKQQIITNEVIQYIFTMARQKSHRTAGPPQLR